MSTAEETEQRRRECEARHVLSLNFALRMPYLERIERRRGAAGRKYLEEEIKRQYALMKKSKQRSGINH